MAEFDEACGKVGVGDSAKQGRQIGINPVRPSGDGLSVGKDVNLEWNSCEIASIRCGSGEAVSVMKQDRSKRV